MKTTHQRAFLLILTIFVVILSLFNTGTAFADDNVPPVEPVATEVPVATDVSSVMEEVSSETEDQTVLEPVIVSEVLEQLPEDTQVIVLDEIGGIEPLVTEEAAEIIAAGDPVWCPASLVGGPTPGTNGCTASYTSFQGLLTYLDANEQAQAGIIWIESSFDSSINDPSSSGFSITDAFFTTMSNYALTIQGGWSGISGDAIIGSASIFNGDSLHIKWNANITVNNIAINNATGLGSAISLESSQDISMNDVVASNNTSTGISASTGTNIYLNNISANNNGYNGASLSVASITLNGINTFNNNAGLGLDITTPKEVTLNNVTANENFSTGVYVYNSGGTEEVIINSTNTLNNSGHGLYINSNGNININNLVSTENTGFGAEMYNNNGGTGNVLIDNSTLSNNEAGATIISSGDVTLNNITSNGNTTYGGIQIGNYFGSGNVVITDSDFSHNEGSGLGVSSYGDVFLTNITTSENNGSGTSLDNYGNGSIFVSSSQFNSNAYYGIDARYATAPMLLNNVSFDCLNGLGDYIYNGTVFHACATPMAEENPVSKKTNDAFSLHVVSVNDGESIELDCQQYAGTMLILSNGNRTIFNCLITGSGSLVTLTKDALPSNLPEGVDFISGMQATQSPEGNDKALDGQIIISFLIPENMQSANLAILYWDGSQWTDLKSASFEDGRVVINGGYVPDDGYFEAVTNFSGNFVLVIK